MPIYCVPMFVEFVILGVAKTTPFLSVSNEAGELMELNKYTLSKILSYGKSYNSILCQLQELYVQQQDSCISVAEA